jgi:hypothetical protein
MDDSNKTDVARIAQSTASELMGRPSPEAHIGPNDLGVGVWDTCYIKQSGARAYSRRIAFLTHRMSDFGGFELAAARLVVDVHRSSYVRSAMWDIMHSPGSWLAVVMRYSDFGSVSQTFNIMRSFRLRCPSVPFILASEELSGDDLTLERLPICDVSIKLPMDMSCFPEVVNRAETNNHIWIERNQLMRSGLN